MAVKHVLLTRCQVPRRSSRPVLQMPSTIVNAKRTRTTNAFTRMTGEKLKHAAGAPTK